MSAPSEKASPSATAKTFYRQFKGAVAGQPITMNLIKYEDQYEGWYYYDKIGDPIRLFPQQDSTGRIVLIENTSPDDNNTFTGKIDAAGHFTGTWKNSRKRYDFDLRENNTNTVQFNVFGFSDSASLFPANPKSPVGTASSAIVWPTGGADDEVLKVIREAIAPHTKYADKPELIVKIPVDTFLRDYKSNRDDVDTNEINNGMGASWSWNTASKIQVVWNQPPLLVLEYADYSYTGGAHGNYGSNFVVIDLSKKKILKPNDVFKPGFKAALGAALEKSFRKKYNVPASEPLNKGYLFDKHIEPNENFFITAKGVVFNYTPYEIAAYAMGEINLFVPFEDLKSVLKEGYIQ